MIKATRLSDPRGRSIKIATFNVNNVDRRLPNLLAWMKASQPDVICLQELKTPQDRFPVEAFAKAGYGAIWRGQRTWNGVAILTKGETPIQTRDELPGDSDDIQSRYIEAAIEGFLVGCIYLPNGNPQPGPKFDYKLRWFDRLIRHARSLRRAGHPVVLAGDYNVVPTSFDIYPTKSWDKDALLQPESRAAFQKLLKGGWIDAIRHLYPDKPMYSFWDYKRDRWARDAGLRLDYFLLSPEVAGRLVDGGVDRHIRGEEGASDHAPVWIELTRFAK